MKSIFKKAAYYTLMTAATVGGVAILVNAVKNDMANNKKRAEYVAPKVAK